MADVFSHCALPDRWAFAAALGRIRPFVTCLCRSIAKQDAGASPGARRAHAHRLPTNRIGRLQKAQRMAARPCSAPASCMQLPVAGFGRLERKHAPSGTASSIAMSVRLGRTSNPASPADREARTAIGEGSAHGPRRKPDSVRLKQIDHWVHLSRE